MSSFAGRRAAHAQTQAPSSGERPYRGSAPFAEENASYFFGREPDRARVTEMLYEHRLAVLHGPSGAGKSSLLRAGIAGKLLAEARSRYAEGRSGLLVPIVFSAWASDPRVALKRSIRAVLESFRHRLASELPAGSLKDAIQAAAQLLRGELLIVLDQFEEYFLELNAAREHRLPAWDLARILKRTDGAARWLVCIRSEALGELDRFGGRLPALIDTQTSIAHLDRTAGREAIEAPIARWNELHSQRARQVSIDSGLIEAVLAGIALREAAPQGTSAGEAPPTVQALGERIQAPYLQIVMARLWDAELNSESRALRLETLERLGGTRGILAEHLNAAMATLTPHEQSTAARALRPLVTLSNAGVSQLAEYAELPEEDVRPVLEGLAREPRILRPIEGDAGYAIYNEALAQPILRWCKRWDSRLRGRGALKRVLATAGATACILAAIALVHGFSGLELATLDARFSVRGAQRPPANLVLVKIDDASLRGLNREWPLPRRIDAEAIERIGEQHPRVIAYDVDFSGHNEPFKESEALLEAISGSAPRVVLAASEPSPQGATDILGGAANLREVGAGVGFSGFPTDLGGAIRRPLYFADGLRSFAVVAAETAGARPVPPHDFAHAWIDYYGPSETIGSVSFFDLLRRRLPPDLLRGKVVVVGVTSLAAGDYHYVSGPNRPFVSGAEIQATAIENVLRGLPLRDAPGWLTLLAIAVFVLVSAIAGLRLRLRAMLAIALVLALAWLLAAQLAFDGGRVLAVVYPVGALLIGTLMAALVGFTSSSLRRGGGGTGCGAGTRL